MINNAGNGLVAHIGLPLGPIAELIRHACGGQLLVQHGAVGGIAGIEALPPGRARRNGQQVGVLGHQRIDDAPYAVLVANAHVHVRAPKQHLLAPVLGARDDFLIAGLIRKRVLPEVRKRVATRGPDVYAQFIGCFFHCLQGSVQVSDGFRHGMADAGDQLHRVLEKFLFQMNLGVGCSGEVNEFCAARDKVARATVHERHLPFHAERWFGRAGELFCRDLHPFSLTGDRY